MFRSFRSQLTLFFVAIVVEALALESGEPSERAQRVARKTAPAIE